MRHFLNSSPIRVRTISKLCIIVSMKKCLNFNGSKQPSIIGALSFARICLVKLQTFVSRQVKLDRSTANDYSAIQILSE